MKKDKKMAKQAIRKSPYTSSATIRIGPMQVEYIIPESFVLRWPKLASTRTLWSRFELPDLDEDIGHTLVHFLYTGGYETLEPHQVKGASCTFIEYKRSVQAYHAARTYGLNPLELDAKRAMQSFGNGLSFPEIMGIAVEIYPKFQEDDVWFLDYIGQRTRTAFKEDENLFSSDGFSSSFGRTATFDKFLLRTMNEIYQEKIADILGDQAAQVSVVKTLDKGNDDVDSINTSDTLLVQGDVPEPSTEGHRCEAENTEEPECESKQMDNLAIGDVTKIERHEKPCARQAKHLKRKGKWRSCKQCRAVLAEATVEALEDSKSGDESYEVVEK